MENCQRFATNIFPNTKCENVGHFKAKNPKGWFLKHETLQLGPIMLIDSNWFCLMPKNYTNRSAPTSLGRPYFTSYWGAVYWRGVCWAAQQIGPINYLIIQETWIDSPNNTRIADAVHCHSLLSGHSHYFRWSIVRNVNIFTRVHK